MMPLQEVLSRTEADVALEWKMQGSYLKVSDAAGEGLNYADMSRLAKFMRGEGCVGQAFASKSPIFLQDVGDAPAEFLRKSLALDDGLKSIVFIPQGDSVVELGYWNRLLQAPDIMKGGDTNPEAGGYVSEDHAAILAAIPGIQTIKAEVSSMMESMGFVQNKVVAPDPRDVENTDKWVPRDPRLNRLTGIHPFNCEAPLSLLREHKFLTPASLHYVRNHGICPKLHWSSHCIEITGLVDRPVRLSMAELVKLPKISVPVTLNCAGNRRKEQNLIQKGIGFHWGCAAASTVIWTGVPLREVLKHVGIQEGARWINFAGPRGEVPAGDTTYGASHAREVCMNPARPCMLAFMMNGELLHPDHGYPVRLLMPGYIGGRMIKWVSTISVTQEEGDNHYHIYDNRVFPKHIHSKEIATAEKIWTDPAYTINDRLKYMAEWENWSCKDKWKTPEEFQKHHGDTPIHITEFFPPDSNVKPYKVRIPIKDYISYARETQADFPWYPFERDFDTTVFTKNNHGAKIDQENREFLLQDFQPLPELFGIQDVFELTSRLRHEFFPYSCHRFVILGGKRTGANVHQDPLHTAAWNLLLAGRKRWVFFKPGTGEKEMRLQSVSSKTSTSTQADVDDGARSRIPSTNSRSCSSTTDETESCNSYQKKKPSRYNDSAPFDWWAEAYPKIKEDKTVELYEVVQNPGDTVYIPPDWYHAVLNLDDFTVACTSNVLTVKMLLKILQAYDAEEIKFSDAMLEEMQLGLEILLEEIAAPAQIDKDIINEEMMQRSPKRSSASCIMQKNSCHAAAHDEITTGRRDCRVHYGGS